MLSAIPASLEKLFSLKIEEKIDNFYLSDSNGP